MRNALERIGGFTGVEVRDPIGMINPRAYRNKMSLVVDHSRPRRDWVFISSVRTTSFRLRDVRSSCRTASAQIGRASTNGSLARSPRAGALMRTRTSSPARRAQRTGRDDIHHRGIRRRS